MPCYGDAQTLDDIRQSSTTCSIRRRRRAAGCRSSSCSAIAGPFSVGRSGSRSRFRSGTAAAPILGFRFGRFAYLTDCNRIPDESWPLLDGLDVLVLDALARAAAPDAFLARPRRWTTAAPHRRRAGRSSHTCATICRTQSTSARLAARAWSSLMMASSSDQPREPRCDRPHYPDDPPPRWPTPCWPSATSTGCTAATSKIIDRVRRRAGERGGTPAAMTFDPHPPRVVRPDKAPPLLMTTEQRLEASTRAGMQGVAVVRFTHEMSLWDPETFVRTVLVEWLRVVEVWVGANFLFGHDRAGTFTVLRALGARYGFRAEKIDPVRYKDFVVSSTRVRRLVAEGRVDEAGALLGHHYFIDGTVVKGAQRGRELGFPTANLDTANELLPPAGVYATTAAINGVAHPSVTNIGLRPTFGDVDRIQVETHLLDIDRDLYGARVRLSFVQRLRDERAFPDVDALREQIDADCRSARRLFGHISL